MKKQTQNRLLGGAALTALVANAIFLWMGQGKKPSTQESGELSSPSQSSSEATTAVGQEASQSSTGLADGTYTGAVTSTNRGDYQVQLTISGGQMTDIQVIEYPQDNGRSQSINANALPIYREEALEAQSSEVTQISGATEAYRGFTGSLQDAINQAQS